MLKVNILNEANTAETEADQFVEQTKQILLEENTQERSILSAAGLDSQSVLAFDLRHENSMRKELKMKTGAQAVLTLNEIRSLCLKYRLRFLKSHRYKGPIDNLIGRKIKKFMEDIGDVAPEYSAKERLYVMAPADAFSLEIGKVVKDPVLFYRHESGLYAVIHKWGNDFTIWRRVTGFLTLTGARWRWFLFIAINAIGIGTALPLHAFGFKDAAVVAFFAGLVFSVGRWMNSSTNQDHYTFSNKAWNAEARNDTVKLLWI